jgi:NhaP-type Na+/H+ or K+/H+ antiporter
MSLLVWFSFGAVMLVPGFQDATWRDVLYGLLALTVVRMVPVALSLVGTGLDRSTVAFIGWFGPRGLASVVFALIAVDTLAPPDARTVLGAVTVTVALSVLLHGVTASPLAARYGARAHQLHRERPEHRRSGHPISTRRIHSERLPLGRRVIDR